MFYKSYNYGVLRFIVSLCPDSCKVWLSDSRSSTGSSGLVGQPVFERVIVSRRDVLVSRISVLETRRSGPKYRQTSKTKDKVLHDFTACCD